MAKAMIVFEDTPDGTVEITWEFDPQPDSLEEMTHAQNMMSQAFVYLNTEEGEPKNG